MLYVKYISVEKRTLRIKMFLRMLKNLKRAKIYQASLGGTGEVGAPGHSRTLRLELVAPGEENKEAKT